MKNHHGPTERQTHQTDHEEKKPRLILANRGTEYRYPSERYTTRACKHHFIHLFNYFVIYSLTYLFICLLINLIFFTHLIKYMFIYILIYSIGHLFIYLLNYFCLFTYFFLLFINLLFFPSFFYLLTFSYLSFFFI